MQDREQLIQQAIQRKAYFLWEEAGKPPGREFDFWEQAKRWYFWSTIKIHEFTVVDE